MKIGVSANSAAVCAPRSPNAWYAQRRYLPALLLEDQHLPHRAGRQVPSFKSRAQFSKPSAQPLRLDALHRLAARDGVTVPDMIDLVADAGDVRSGQDAGADGHLISVGRSCHGLGAFPDYSWMPRGNAKESERRPFGASPVLLPVAKRMNADTDRRSESDL